MIDRFQRFMRELEPIRLPMEIWIDGSFATLKPEPGDIDIVVFIDPVYLNQLSERQYALLDRLTKNSKAVSDRYSCDLHIEDRTNADQLEYWKLVFGTDRSNINSKGIYRIINPHV